MAEEQPQREPTQPTQPKQGEPIQIPIPKRRDVENLFRKAALTKPKKDAK